MFYCCSNLFSLYLTNFDTSNVTDMSSMFYKNLNILSLDLSNFRTSKVETMNSMFYGCSKLSFLDLTKFDTSKVKEMNGMFRDCSNLSSLDLSNFITSNVEIMHEMFYNCKKLSSLDLSNFNTSKVSQMQKMFYDCIQLEYISLKNFNENNLINVENIFLNVPDNASIYLNTNCKKILEELNKKYNCSFDNISPNEYQLLSKEECFKKNKIKNMVDNLEQIENNKNEEIKFYDTILEYMEDMLTSKYYDSSNLDNGNDETFEIGKLKITFSTTQNQKNNINDNTTKIDLGECENSLRQSYNLSDNETIYLKIIEKVQEGMRIPKIEYEIYSKLSGDNLKKLNLIACKNDKIYTSVYAKISENLDKLNSNSGYYNDICYTATSESGTDISNKDRKNEYPNIAVCQDDCEFVDYNYNTEKAICSCKIQESSASFKDININKQKLLDNFKNIKNIANFNLLICIDVLFCKLGLKTNVGFFIFISIILLRIVILFVFYLNQSKRLKNKINDLIFAIKNLKLIKDKDNNKREGNKRLLINKKQIKSKKNNKYKNKKKKEPENKSNNIIQLNNIKNSNKKKVNKNKKIIKSIKEGKTIDINKKKDNKDNLITINLPNNKNNKKRKKNNKRNNSIKNNTKIIEQKKIKRIKIILDYTDDEMNDLPYALALLNDKRTYCQYYISLIRTKHDIVFSFCNNKDYNSRIIKIDLFFIIFSLNYAVNGFFYNDATMHNIYVNKGAFDIEYQLPKIFYSALISSILGIILKKLSLSNDEIIDFKKDREEKNVEEKAKKLNSKIKIKFIFYFILSFIFLLFFCYYVSMFDAVYRNTQFLLLEDTLVSFGLSLIYPFFIFLIPGIFRIPALKDPQKKSEYMYRFSKVFHLL